ncbi:C-terminal processing protease CtpA/Prc [Bacteroides zoogleoformans]|uniref:Peptidase S41 n=1 Tax=Bacteroides zoogleoformans TaxID=28119 RepID=A0ABM6T8Q1_9BACE|nr:S41 family peptidase [Bacteroides zoogleoformans]AVM53221.1 peptidase S41 [Bacteroides zoogleoformans]TWJ17843.1 C-terminal processing protease CtpA/Prc [Bacteroides zoogleoformans]
MKLKHYFIFILFTLTTIGLGSCHDDDDAIQPGITGQSWQEGKAVEITPGEILSVTFNAAAKWTATTNSDWCTILTPSGEKGPSTLKLSTTTGTSEVRTSTISIKVDGYSTINFDVKQNIGEAPATEDMKVNIKVAEYLKANYLWNDEYKTLTLDYTKNYEDFFYESLKSMKTNTLDKKPYKGDDGNTYYRLFSYIRKKNPVTKTRAKLVEKELSYSFGITGITPFGIGKDSVCFVIQGVYPDSPATAADLKRGSIIGKVNNERLNESNWIGKYYALQMPDAISSLTLTEMEIIKGKLKEIKNISLTSDAIYLNPVITSKVAEIDGHKIGYLVYSEFEASFDQELFDAFKKFKAQNVTDLILDLRYNGGGDIMSANLIASCIAAEAAERKVFSSFRYNEERMKKRGNKREEWKFAYPDLYSNLDEKLTEGGLRLNKVYCLVGGGTASSSELVINSLRGIDLEVILIGKTTTGKNVGMEVENFAVEGHVYEVVPITFQSYNAKGFGDYGNGFKPDWNMDEVVPIKVYPDYGTDDEPLYAKAIELITGKIVMTGSTTRGTGKTLKVQKIKAPAIYRPGYNGMLKRYEED